MTSSEFLALVDDTVPVGASCPTLDDYTRVLGVIRRREAVHSAAVVAETAPDPHGTPPVSRRIRIVHQTGDGRTYAVIEHD